MNSPIKIKHIVYLILFSATVFIIYTILQKSVNIYKTYYANISKVEELEIKVSIWSNFEGYCEIYPFLDEVTTRKITPEEAKDRVEEKYRAKKYTTSGVKYAIKSDIKGTCKDIK